jgi:phage baseplate assembly protein W
MANVERFGRGIARPFQRDGKGDFRNDSGEAILRNDVVGLVQIVGPSPTSAGELPWRCDLGTRIMVMKHRSKRPEMFAATADYEVGSALRKFEPRVVPSRVAVTQDLARQTTSIKVCYRPINTFGEQQSADISLDQE